MDKDSAEQIVGINFRAGNMSPITMHFYRVLWYECLYPPKIHVEILTLKAMVFGGETFRRCLGNEDGTLINGISAF